MRTTESPAVFGTPAHPWVGSGHCQDRNLSLYSHSGHRGLAPPESATITWPICGADSFEGPEVSPAQGLKNRESCLQGLLFFLRSRRATLTPTIMPAATKNKPMTQGSTGIPAGLTTSGARIVTRNDPVATLPDKSRAEQATCVSPTGNREPEASSHVTTGEGSTASSAITWNVTMTPEESAACRTISGGRRSVGFVVSRAVT